MTEEAAEQPEAKADDLLVSLVSIVNRLPLDVSFGVTLLIGGCLVTGFLVSGESYFAAFGKDFASGIEDEENRGSLEASFASLGEKYAALREEGDSEDDDPFQTVYLHMRDARFFTPGQGPVPTEGGVWWRGRISEVSGFNLGILSLGEPPALD